jgi:hypothetical protein
MSAAVASAAEKEKAAERQQAALSKAKAVLEEEKVRTCCRGVQGRGMHFQSSCARHRNNATGNGTVTVKQRAPLTCSRKLSSLLTTLR